MLYLVCALFVAAVWAKVSSAFLAYFVVSGCVWVFDA